MIQLTIFPNQIVNKTTTPLTMTLIQFMNYLRLGRLRNFSYLCSGLDFVTQCLNLTCDLTISFHISRDRFQFSHSFCVFSLSLNSTSNNSLEMLMIFVMNRISPQHSTVFFSISFKPPLLRSISDGYGAINQPGWLDTRKINFSKDQPNQLHIQSNKPELSPFTALD